VTRIDVETYRIAAEHAHTGWGDFASAQLSFPFLIGLALTRRGIKMKDFDDDSRRDPAFARIASMLHVSAPPEIDRLYPRLRPARVTVTTPRGAFTRQADEALGSRIVPLDDAGLKAKFDAPPTCASACGRSRPPGTCGRSWSLPPSRAGEAICKARTIRSSGARCAAASRCCACTTTMRAEFARSFSAIRARARRRR
jgi:hypothetical protein